MSIMNPAVVGGALGIHFTLVLACSESAAPGPKGSATGGTPSASAGGSGGSASSPSSGSSSMPDLGNVSPAAGEPVEPASALPPIKPDPGAFPAEPVIVQAPGAPALPLEAAALLIDAPEGLAGALCLVEPVADTLVPRNWPRARLRVTGAPSGHNAFQFRFSAPGQTHVTHLVANTPDLVLPAELWQKLIVGVVDVPIGVEVRSALVANGVLQDGPSAWAHGGLRIAPVEAPGTIVYWYASEQEESRLKGFRVGDESVVEVLRYEQVQMDLGARERCVGCHSSTPDGEYIGVSAEGPGGYTLGLASGQAAMAGARPAWLGAGAALVLGEGDMGAHAFSAGHWAPGNRLLVTRREIMGQVELVWVDLEAALPQSAMGVVARSSDPRGVFAPSWSRDGSFIVYTSTNATAVGHGANEADLYRVPFGDRSGGTAQPLAGASTPEALEYYPALSPDASLVAFTRAPATTPELYDRRDGEVWVVPSEGGEATRLAGNDAPECLNDSAEGLANSWPRWSPEIASASGSTYYFLTFSSRRRPETVPQIYLSPLVRRPDGAFQSYPAVRFWNQPATEGNHTPAWDTFKIPPVEPPH